MTLEEDGEERGRDAKTPKSQKAKPSGSKLNMGHVAFIAVLLFAVYFGYTTISGSMNSQHLTTVQSITSTITSTALPNTTTPTSTINQVSTTSTSTVLSTTTAISSITTTIPANSSRLQTKWIVASGSIQALAPYFSGGMSNATLQEAFNNSNTYLISGNNDTTASKFSKAVKVYDTKNYSNFISKGQYNISSGTKAILYDSENWSFTPYNEQLCPWCYASAMANWTAQSHSIHTFIAAPGLDVVIANNTLSCPANPIWSCNAYKYYNYGYGLKIAGYANVFDLQSQSLEQNTSSFTNFTKIEISLLKLQYPNLAILVGITDVSRNGTAVTGSLMYKDAISVSGSSTSGYWLNVDNSSKSANVSAAANFLKEWYAST